MAAGSFPPGTLIAARGRDWVVLPDSAAGFVVARPLNGDPELVAGLFPDEVREVSFPEPTADLAGMGDPRAAGLLRTALRIGFTAGAGPFRSLASIAVEPRQYQLVPLLLALRMPVVRLLIGDDVGVGKTIEAGLIARELLEQGEAERLAVLCPPALAEQWQAELAEKFALDATLVLRSTVTRLERGLRAGESLFERYPCTVVSTDFVKSPRHRAQFLRGCPSVVIVDEAHTCASAGAAGQQRHSLLRELAADPARHLILVTATPHGGKERAFRDLIGLLDPELATLDLSQPRGRDRLARHFVQRRRRDIRSYLDEETAFPRDRQLREVPYELTESYRAFSQRVLGFARAAVADPALQISPLHRRVRWWSALALLRSVASSPRAAAVTLRARSAAAMAGTPAEADELGRCSVLDLAEGDAFDGLDAAPGADDEELPRASRDRLRALARAAGGLAGPDADAKLAMLIKEVDRLLADGFDPIVFCRFIPTAEYVAKHLSAALGRRARAAAVTGALPAAERLARIGALTAEPGRHVLVATDCLAEGVNLQEHFQAVVHYDLAWHPTRHEQREGRVDRFGQRRTFVRAVTLYGVDNGIDGVVLDVLIRKHRTIARQTGVAVPVPDRGDGVLQALVEGLLLRQADPQQLALDLDLGKKRDQLHREWESAAQRESRRLTKYAQSSIKLAEVGREVAAARAAVGGHADVANFARASLAALGATVRTRSGGFTARPAGLPDAVRHGLGIGEEPAADVVFHADLPVPPGEHVLARTDPLVRDLARYVLDAALNPAAAGLGGSPARRGGVIRTHAVTTRTTLLLVRYRFHLTLPGRTQPRATVAEDARLLAYRLERHGREWLPDDETETLLAATAESLPPDLAQRAMQRAITELTEIRRHLDEHGELLAGRLLAAHSRVRAAAGNRGVAVIPSGHADVLGLYVYLPAAQAAQAGGDR